MSREHPALMKVPLTGHIIDTQPLYDLTVLLGTDYLTAAEKDFAAHKLRETCKHLKETAAHIEARLPKPKKASPMRSDTNG